MRSLWFLLFSVFIACSALFSAGVYPDGSTANDGNEWSRSITVPAGQVYRFDYTFNGHHNMGITIWDDTHKQLLKFEDNWHRMGVATGFATTNRNSNIAVTYVINGFGKSCWANKSRCGSLPWFQEKVKDLGQNNFGFTAREFEERVHINFHWSKIE